MMTTTTLSQKRVSKSPKKNIHEREESLQTLYQHIIQVQSGLLSCPKTPIRQWGSARRAENGTGQIAKADQGAPQQLPGKNLYSKCMTFIVKMPFSSLCLNSLGPKTIAATHHHQWKCDETYIFGICCFFNLDLMSTSIN